jgi:hypothetical protein
MVLSLHKGFLSCWLMLAVLLIATVVYWPGLSGSWLFDDYPNIVDNHGVQPADASLPSLVNAALASPSSEFKRPLASLSFAVNYLAVGLNPYWWKLTNLLIHLLNGVLVFVLARALLRTSMQRKSPALVVGAASAANGLHAQAMCDGSAVGVAKSIATEVAPTATESPLRTSTHEGIVAALIAASWMLLPINLTGVLYVVQRMESMANLFVLLGLIGYVSGRRRMLAAPTPSPASRGGLGWGRFSPDARGFALCLFSIIFPTAVGMLAKETAVMLPLYALLIEWILFGFRASQKPLSPWERGGGEGSESTTHPASPEPSSGPASHLPPRGEGIDKRIVGMFLLVLVLPMIAGLAWLLPGLLKPEAWATRDFTLGTRLLSEARIVVDYLVWTLLPTAHALSFYHDDFQVSSGLLTPWSTLASIVLLAALIALMLWLRTRRPLAALGIALFLGCQLLTGTILPLELIYEHRNYFASFGLLLALVPMLGVPQSFPVARLRYALLAGLLLYWTTLTAMTAYAWGDPLRLAKDLASRAPQSPRAQYELGRTYIIDSHYDRASPFTALAYAPLELAASLPNSSILPQQALIFMNSRMHLPLKDAWWDSMIAKLKAHDPGVQDESSLAALVQCSSEQHCDLPRGRMIAAFTAALSHPHPNARLLATYGDYAWNLLDNHELGERMTSAAVKVKPDEAAYRITLMRMLLAQERYIEARQQLKALDALNIGGRLDAELTKLKRSLPQQ